MTKQKSSNINLTQAKRAKNDEFYTQYYDIEKEVNAYLEYDENLFKDKTILLPCDDPEWSNFTKYFAQNFERFGIKKLISTSYAPTNKVLYEHKPSTFETNNPKYDYNKSISNGKVFTLTRDITGDGNINYEDLEWEYLEGDGDFRSDEVTALRDEADFIITNPPFSLFREFMAWLMESEKQFLIIGNMNAITYKEVFPLIKDNLVWLGVNNGAKEYVQPDGEIQKMGNTNWFTNIDHGRRHEPLQLMTYDDNVRFNSRLKGVEYQKYHNFDGIEVPFTNAIPLDYDGVMGVPISFLDKYCPEQFEIVGLGIANLGLECGVKPYDEEHRKYRREVQKRGVVDGDLYMIKDDIVVVPYARILIKHKKQD